MTNLSNNFLILLILTLAFVARLISIYIYGDTTIDKEWGIMLYNLETHNILSVRSIDVCQYKYFYATIVSRFSLFN